jgi:hypothetical protein
MFASKVIMFEKTLEFKSCNFVVLWQVKNIEFATTRPKGPSVGHYYNCDYMFESNGVYMCVKSIQTPLVVV